MIKRILLITLLLISILSYGKDSLSTQQNPIQSFNESVKNNTTEKTLLHYINNWYSYKFSLEDGKKFMDFILQKTDSINLRDSVKAAIYFNAANIINYRGDLYKAYKLLDKANTYILKCQEENKQIDFLAGFHRIKGELYYKFKRYPEAKKNIIKALHFNTLPNKSKAGTMNTLGIILREMDMIDSTIIVFEEALSIAKEENLPRWQGIIIGNLGFAYYQLGQEQKAIEYLETDKTLSIQNKEFGSAINAISLLLNIAIKNDSLQAINENTKLLDSIIPFVNNNQILFNYFRSKTNYWEYKGNYKNALSNFQKSVSYKEKFDKELSALGFQNMIFQINFEKKKAETQILKEKQKRTKLFYSGILIILLLTIFICLLSLYQIRKRRKTEKRILQIKNDTIQFELETNQSKLKKLLENISQKNDLIDTLKEEIKNKEIKEDSKAIQLEKEKLFDKIQSFTLATENDLSEFKHIFNKIHPGFYNYLSNRFAQLSNAEMRLAMLIKLSLSTFEMAKILGISENSVRKTNLRLRKKLDIETTDELDSFIQKLNPKH